jgi:dipeptidyl aminopeptidase/acylaminoacyl peptidase
MSAKNSLKTWTQYVFLLLFGIVLICASCQSNAAQLQRHQLSQRLIDLERGRGWHIVVHEMDDISYFSASNGSLEALYSRFGKRSHSWIGHASVRADGKKLTLVTNSYDQPSAALIVFDIGAAKEETIVTMPYIFGPRWSPDGMRIAFASRSESKGNFDLNVYQVATSEVSVALTEELPACEGYFDWSPDSQRIVYESATGQIGIVDIQTKKTRMLGKGGSPTWSPTGKLICYHEDGEDALVLLDTETNQSRIILKGRRASTPAWSPDGRLISYSRPYSEISKQIKNLSMLVDTHGDLWAMDTTSEVEVKLFTAGESLYPTYWGPIAPASVVPH